MQRHKNIPGGDVVDAVSGSVDKSALVVKSCSHSSTSTLAAAASASVRRPPPKPKPPVVEMLGLDLDWFGEILLLDLAPPMRAGLLMLPMLPPALALSELCLKSASDDDDDMEGDDDDGRSDEYAF